MFNFFKLAIVTTGDYLSPSINKNVHIAGKKIFLIQGDVPQLFNWEEYGLKIDVLEGTLSSSETAEVTIFALVGGQFVFPKNTQVVSAVYSIAVSKPLLQPLRLHLQHCVNLARPSQARHLKFVIAPADIPSPAYEFSPVEGGEFTVNSYYGSIYRDKFSLAGIIAEQEHNGGTNNSTNGENGEDPSSSSDSESTQSIDSVKMKDTNTQGQSVYYYFFNDISFAVSACTAVQSDKVKDDPSLQVSSVKNILDIDSMLSVLFCIRLLYCIIESDSTGIAPTDLFYTGMIYYEEKKAEHLVTFTAAKSLNALLKVYTVIAILMILYFYLIVY